MIPQTTFIIILAAWICIVSIILFAMMGIDKSRAKRHARRIRERTLFLTALFGGGPGGVIGMAAFRHKTKHTSFVMGMPLLLLFNLLFAAFLIWLNLQIA